MATPQDSDYILVNRDGVDYKITYKDFTENLNSEPPVVIGSVEIQVPAEHNVNETATYVVKTAGVAVDELVTFESSNSDDIITEMTSFKSFKSSEKMYKFDVTLIGGGSRTLTASVFSDTATDSPVVVTVDVSPDLYTIGTVSIDGEASPQNYATETYTVSWDGNYAGEGTIEFTSSVDTDVITDNGDKTFDVKYHGSGNRTLTATVTDDTTSDSGATGTLEVTPSGYPWDGADATYHVTVSDGDLCTPSGHSSIYSLEDGATVVALSKAGEYVIIGKETKFTGSKGNWDFGTHTETMNVTDMSFMFKDATAFNSDVSMFNTSNVTTMESMFQSAEVFDQDLNSWQVGNVENMARMFSDAYEFNSALNSWQVGSVTTMDRMFLNTQKFNSDITNWNTSQVTDFTSMFENTVLFDQPIGVWNVVSVPTKIGMVGMFKSSQAFYQDLTGWCVRNIDSMPRDFIKGNAQMLANGDYHPCWTRCPNNEDGNGESVCMPWHGHDGGVFHIKNGSAALSFPAGPHLAWDQDLNELGEISQVEANKEVIVIVPAEPSAGLFSCTQNFEFGEHTDTSKCKNLDDAFAACPKFNSDIGNWDVSNVRSMSRMFKGCSAFNTSISEWDTHSCLFMSSMFENAKTFNQPCNQWCVPNISSTPTRFARGASAFSLLNYPKWGECPRREDDIAKGITIGNAKIQVEVVAEHAGETGTYVCRLIGGNAIVKYEWIIPDNAQVKSGIGTEKIKIQWMTEDLESVISCKVTSDDPYLEGPDETEDSLTVPIGPPQFFGRTSTNTGVDVVAGSVILPNNVGINVSTAQFAKGNGIVIRGNRFYSTDGGKTFMETEWIKQKNGGNYSTVCFGNNVFVAFESSANPSSDLNGKHLMWSSDGTNWNYADAKGQQSTSGHAMAYGNNTFVAVSSTSSTAHPNVFTSADGKTWDYQQCLETAGGNALPQGSWNVGFGAGKFVAVAYGPKKNPTDTSQSLIYTSVNGKDWTPVDYNNGNNYSWLKYRAVTFGAGVFVAQGYYNPDAPDDSQAEDEVFWSTDAVTWQAADIPDVPPGNYGRWLDVAWCDDMFVMTTHAQNEQYQFASSLDGKSWTLTEQFSKDVSYTSWKCPIKTDEGYLITQQSLMLRSLDGKSFDPIVVVTFPDDQVVQGGLLGSGENIGTLSEHFTIGDIVDQYPLALDPKNQCTGEVSDVSGNQVTLGPANKTSGWLPGTSLQNRTQLEDS